MLPRRWFLTGVAASLILLSASAGAQGPPRGMTKNVYNPAALETLTGQIADVDLMRTRSGRGCSVILTLEKADKKKIDINLGPISYVEEQPVELNKGDKVDVKGSWVTRRGFKRFVAGEVRKGNEVLKLRDETGHPLWLPPRR